MNRAQHLKLANAAVTRAERLAGDAEKYATNPDYPHKVAPLAAAATLWADIARTHTAIAAALPQMEV
ncbi:hypothetical protein ACI2L1_12105 [Streptomyces sp. NPDC019531]|uniref:hypothetical protein n=1 Tax=Streptomyces sp. NPDC019531 TaxID=3365062 RepID=UPI00384E6B69